MTRLDSRRLHRFGIRQTSQMVDEMHGLFIDRCILFVCADRALALTP